ncbi:hypothetical protein [Marinobacter changyiensis]|uniref:hypothetical protein n=1 Tax=Marinobacter changyiensis TaxID=2604091 RepID=UPI001263EFC6|nr:hypothetical protein [Marinobacter changyiensis]
MNLSHYIQRIRQGEPVNYHGFVKHLPAAIRSRHQRLFSTEKVAANRWQVDCLDAGLLDELEAEAAMPQNRTEAALLGDSHRRQTDTSFLLVYHSALADCRPAVVVLTASEQRQDFVAKPNVLLIENEQNFARPEPMLAFAAHCCGTALSLDNTDVVLAGGNRIVRSLNVTWLGQYRRVLCAFDYDLGGLRIYSSLRTRLGDGVLWVQPQRWQSYQGLFRMKPKSTERALQAIELARQLGFVGLAETFRNTGHFMEQEMILELAVLPGES